MATRLKQTDVVIVGLGAVGGVAALPLAQLVWREVTFGEPGPGLEADHVQSGLRQGKSGDAADSAEAHDDDVGLFQSSRHSRHPRGSARSRKLS